MRSAATASALSNSDNGHQGDNSAHGEEVPAPSATEFPLLKLPQGNPKVGLLRIAGLLVPPVAVPLARISSHSRSLLGGDRSLRRETAREVCDREHREEVFAVWREIALALFCIVASLLIAAIVLSPLLVGLGS